MVVLERVLSCHRVSDLERFGSRRLESTCLKVDGVDGVTVLATASLCGFSSSRRSCVSLVWSIGGSVLLPSSDLSDNGSVLCGLVTLSSLLLHLCFRMV